MKFPALRVLACLITASVLQAATPAPAHEIAEPSFRNHVQSVLTKAGCNMGPVTAPALARTDSISACAAITTRRIGSP